MNVGLLVAFLLNVKKALSHLVFYPEFPNDLANSFNLPLCSSHFSFLVTFGDKVMKIRKYYVIFVYILQGKMGKTEKNRKENHATRVTKLPKTKRQIYEMNETEMNLYSQLTIFHKIKCAF